MDPLKEAVSSGVSVNERAATLVDRLVADAAELKIGVARGSLGELLIDAGANHPGSIAAGLRIAEICMGGLGTCRACAVGATPNWPWTLVEPLVQSGDGLPGQPICRLEACRMRTVRTNSSRSARVRPRAGRREPLFAELGYRDHAARASLVLESDEAAAARRRREGGARLRRRARRPHFHLCADAEPGRQRAGRRARARSGAAQGARAGFPLEHIVEGIGAAPLPPPHPDLVNAMGRTNDAIIYGGQVQLFVTGPRRRGACAGGKTAERSLARLRPPVRGDLHAV